MVMWGVGEDDTKGRARPLTTLSSNPHEGIHFFRIINVFESGHG